MRWAIESFEATVGQRPLGWYCRYGPSVHTRELLVEEGGFVYDADAYNDDLPYFTEVLGRRHLVVPYSFTYNDARFVLPQGYGSPDDFATTFKRAFDTYWEEGEERPRMMSIGLHPRLVGQAAPYRRAFATSSNTPSTRAARGSPGASTSPSGGLPITRSSSPDRDSLPGRHEQRFEMELHTWSLYASAVLLLCLTPGPNSLLAVTNGLRFGVGKTLFSTFGCAVGLTLLIGASLSGLGLILAASETVFYIIKWLGACYLIYLGISLIRSRGAVADVDKASRPAHAAGREIYLFAQGLWIVVMNPKAVIFFAAFLPQFYDPQHGLLPQFLVMAGTFVGIEVVVEVLLAAFASKLAAYVTSGTGMCMFNRATGGVFVLAGAYLLTLERPR